jgi:hypothetical protein
MLFGDYKAIPGTFCSLFLYLVPRFHQVKALLIASWRSPLDTALRGKP